MMLNHLQTASSNLFLIMFLSLIHSVVAAFELSTSNKPVLMEEVIVTAEMSADDVRKLKRSGEIMSLEDIILQVRNDYPGRIIEIELEDENGHYIYELELVDEKGMVWELEMDAKTGKVIKYEQDD